MSSLFKHPVNVCFSCSWTSKPKDERPLFGIEQGPIGGANDVGFLVILPERWNVLDQNGWNGNGATVSIRVNARDERIAHGRGFGQGRSLLGAGIIRRFGLSGELD